MSKIFRIAIKSLLLITGFVILLIVFINLPFSRNFVTGRVNALFQKLELPLNIQTIKTVRLTKVHVEGFSIIDPRGDTIVYAGNVKAHIKLLALMKSKVVLDEAELSGIGVYLLMNYDTHNYTIAEAFKKKTKKKPADPDKKRSKWEVKIQKGEINSIHFFMEDSLSGIRIEQEVDNLRIEKFRLGLLERELRARAIELNSANGSVKISPKLVEKRELKNRARSPWNFGVTDLAMEDLGFTFEQTSDSLFLNLVLEKGVIGTKEMDIPRKIIDLNEISIEGASAAIFTGLKHGNPDDSNKVKNNDFPWDLKARKVNLERIDFSKGNYSHPRADSSVHGIGLENLDMKLRDFQISLAHTGMDLKKLSFDLNNGFTLEQMKADFDSDSETTRLNLAIETSNSQFSMEAEARGSFFDLLKDPSGTGNGHLVIDQSLISLNDISTFAPSLKEIPAYEMLASSPTRLEVRMDKEKNTISLSELSLLQNKNFKLSLIGSFDLSAEPKNTFGKMDLKLSEINIRWLNDLLLASGLDHSLPDSTEILLEARISEVLKSPEIGLQLQSNMGNIDLSGHLNLKEKEYRLNSKFGQIHLGKIMGIEELGSLTGWAVIEGSGLTAKNIESNIEVRIDSVGYNGYAYTQIMLDGMLQPGKYEFILQSSDPSFNSNLTVDLFQTDTLFSAKVTGSLFAQLDHLQFFNDTLSVNTGITATLVNEPNAFESHILFDGIELTSPEKSATLQHMSAAFRTDTSSTSLIGEGDFFNFDIQVDKSIHKLGTIGESYSNYLKTFVDSSRSNAEQRVAELPGIYATSNITNHEALDLLFQDTGFHISNFYFSIVNDPSKHRVEYNIEGSEIDYKMVHAGDLDVEVTDSAGNLSFEVISNSSSLYSGPLSSFQLNAQFANLKNNTQLSILDQELDTIYNIEIAAEIDSNMMFFKIPPNQITINRDLWQLDRPDFLTIDLESSRWSPEFKINTDSSSLHIVSSTVDGEHTFQIEMDQVRIASLLWDDLMANKPAGSLSGSVDFTTNDRAEKRISTDLWIREVNYSDLKFNEIHLDGFATSSDSGGFSTELSARLDSARIEFATENMFDNNRTINADFSKIPLNTLQSFTRDYLSDMKGNISGNFNVASKTGSEKFNGELKFNGAQLRIIPLNSNFKIPDQGIQFEDDRMVFSNFSILDSSNKALVVDGFVDFRGQRIITDLDISSSRLHLMNTTEKDNEAFYGNLFVDSKISLNGPLTNPDIDAKILLSSGTKLHFNSTDNVDLSESSEIVNFISVAEEEAPLKVSPISTRSRYNLSTVETSIEIEPTTQINFNLSKRIFNINLQIQGGGLLNYNMLNNNQVSLSGRYEISEGSADLNIVGWPNKYFNITRGGYVNWDGNVEDPELMFEAVNRVSTTYANPVDGKARTVDINVVLRLSSHLSDLDILFTINTADQYLMSIINTLSPEEQMRQAITILLFEIIDLPGISSSTNYMTQQVNQIISSQLNQLTKSAIKGVDISFGIDSYSQQNQGGGNQTTTSLSYEVKKSLLNDRAVIEVSGRLYNQNEQPGTMDQSLNNVSFEYQLDSAETKYLKVYNEQTYEDVFEGQVTKTGVGFSYRKPYRTLGDIFKRQKKNKKDPKKIEADEN